MKNISRYSYFLFAIKNKDINQGTGFFIKKADVTYLVTAAHNFHVDKTASAKTTADFYIRLKKNDKSEFILIKNNPLPKTEVTKNLDINFYKVSISSKYELNIIELGSNELKVSENIICYGYAVVDENEDNPQLYMESIEPTKFKGKLKYDYHKPIIYFETKERDYNNYVVEYMVDSLGRGTSGAPVFFVSKKKGIIMYRFAGLIHLRNELTKIATILRPEKIQEQINIL